MKLTDDMRKVLQVTGVALLVTAAVTSQALAQAAGGADVLGVTPVSQSAILTLKAIGLVAIGWGFLRLMGGRHTVEGLVALGVGGLGLAKSTAIASYFGF